jgi:hypothetical protein
MQSRVFPAAVLLGLVLALAGGSALAAPMPPGGPGLPVTKLPHRAPAPPPLPQPGVGWQLVVLALALLVAVLVVTVAVRVSRTRLPIAGPDGSRPVIPRQRAHVGLNAGRPRRSEPRVPAGARDRVSRPGR